MSWNRPNGAPKPVQNKRSIRMRGIVAGLMVVIVAVVGIWRFLGNNKTVDMQRSDKLPNAKEHAVRTPIFKPNVATNKTTCVENTQPTIARVKNDWRKVAIVDFTNEERRAVLMNAGDPDDPSEYGETEQLLGMLFSQPLGMEPPPIPFCFGEDAGLDDFEAGLKNKIVVIDKDDDAKSDRKLAIVQAKLEMLELVTQGETPQTILEDAYKMRKEAAFLRNGMLDNMTQWVEQDSPGDAAIDAAIQQFNQRLEAQGILKITREDLGLEDTKGESEQ